MIRSVNSHSYGIGNIKRYGMKSYSECISRLILKFFGDKTLSISDAEFFYFDFPDFELFQTESEIIEANIKTNAQSEYNL
jgi:hypothetical protein